MCLLDEEPTSSSAAALAHAMSELSERCYSAGWVIGTGHALRELCDRPGDSRWGIGGVAVYDKARLIALSAEAGGWCYWRGNGVVLVPSGEPVPEMEW